MRAFLRGVVIVPALVGFLAGAGRLEAQSAGDWSLGAAWGPVLPLGDTREVVDRVSFRGGAVDLERSMGSAVGLGVSVGWHVLAETADATSSLPSGSVSGTAARTINAVPLMLTARLGRAGDRAAGPFAGVGLGRSWSEVRTDTGPLRAETSGWHDAVMGEVGLVLPRGRARTFVITLRYDRALGEGRIEYLSLSVGSLIGG